MSVEAIVGTYIVLEFFEAYTQKGGSLKQLLIYNSRFYISSPLMYAGVHGSYFFLLFLCLYYDSMLLLMVFVLKSIDMGYKLYLVGKITTQGESYLDEALNGSDIPLNPIYKYISPTIYSLLVYSAIQG